MKLSRTTFADLVERGQLVVSLVGMSNVGKTRWSTALASVGFTHQNCDDLIELKLEGVLQAEGFEGGIQEVARWMGMPYEDRYSATQSAFLNLERSVMNMLLDSTGAKSGNTVIDTTGSVVHLGEDTCRKLKEQTFIIYLAAPEKLVDEMFRRYREEPKPVVFGDFYRPIEGELREETLSRCYRELLRGRAELYARYADLTIEADMLEAVQSAQEFLTLIGDKLDALDRDI